VLSARLTAIGFWESYAGLVAAVVLCILEAFLIGILFLEWRRRRRAERSLAERLAFEELLSELHAEFVSTRTEDIDAQLMRALTRVSESLGVDKGGLMDYARKEENVYHQLRWARRPDIPIPPSDLPTNYPWALARLLEGKVNRFTRPDELPPEAAVDRRSYERIGTLSHIAVPLVLDEAVLGTMFFATVDQPREWPDDLVRRLQLLGKVFAYVLARKRSDDAVRESRELSTAIVESLPDKVVVIDRAGTIIAMNERDRNTSRPVASDEHLGVNYLDLWRRPVLGGGGAVAAVRAGVASVLAGTLAQFATEFQLTAANGGRWFELRARPLRRAAGGAVLARIDITDRKLAEAEARSMREELARVVRMTTLGQLTATIAHEVNQPLTGIMANAQAARKFLQSATPDLEEIREIIEDIIEDDQRASRVLQRLRSMLRRREPELVTIDVNHLVADVVRFLHSDAVIRNVEVLQELEPALPVLQGDLVQLQQVLVNLVLNGLEAMASVPVDSRRITIRTERTAGGLLVTVMDSGPGLGDKSLDELFELFHTTKADGMGMGLPIARSIVEAHGGRLVASNNPDGGATFSFTLPMAGARSDAEVSAARPA
jgi:two-component system sensor kinase FixL